MNMKEKVRVIANKCELDCNGPDTQGSEAVVKGYFIWWCKTHNQPWAWCKTDIATQLAEDLEQRLIKAENEFKRVRYRLENCTHCVTVIEAIDRLKTAESILIMESDELKIVDAKQSKEGV